MRTRLQKQEKGTGKYIFECIKTPNIYNFRFAIIHTKNNRIVSALYIYDCPCFSISQSFFLLYHARYCDRGSPKNRVYFLLPYIPDTTHFLIGSVFSSGGGAFFNQLTDIRNSASIVKATYMLPLRVVAAKTIVKQDCGDDLDKTMGPYDAFRDRPAATQYGEIHTTASVDVFDAGLIFAFAAIGFSFFILLPGYVGKEVRFIMFSF